MGMNRRTIDSIITKKFNAWVSTIDDECVRNLVENNTIITGGCIASMLMGEKANDFDVYFANKETTMVVAEYYAKKYSEISGVPVQARIVEGTEQVRVFVDGDMNRVSSLYKTMSEESDEGEAALNNDEDTGYEIKPYSPVFISPNAISLSEKVQIILRFYGDADAIHANFDFIHCHNSWHSKKGITLNPDAVEAILAKQLTYTGSLYPMASIIRTRKFLKRGWKINAGQYLKMCLQISDLDLTDVYVLQDQLTGVDVAYFFQIIDSINKDDKEKINTSYITEIIDRLF